MASAKQLPSGSWRVQVYAGKAPDGKRQYISITKPTKKEAEFEALQFQLHHKEISRDSSNMTLDEAMGKYIASKDGILSPSTIRGYENIRRNNLQGLMDMRLNRLTPQIIQQAINKETKPYTDKRGRQKVRTPKTIRNIHGLLSAVLAEYHPSLTLRTTLPQKEIKEQQILEPEQIAALLKAVEGKAMELPVLMGVWLCMRASEISALTWDCVDFERKTLTIKKALVRDKDNQWVEKGTKTTGSTRTVSVPDYILEKLQAVKDSGTGERVVPLSSESMYKRLKTILKKHGLPDIRFHDLRHTSASVMAALNIPTKYAQARGGWSTPTTMQRVYQHTMASKRTAIDEAIDGYFSELLDQEKAGETPPNV